MKIIVNGIATEYHDEGKGQVILFLHGWMHSLHNFDALAQELRGKYRIVRLDLPGFGGTEMPSENWHVVDYALFVRDFLHKLGITPHSLIGHSFGGRIVIKGAAGGILGAETLVLIDAAGNADRKTARNRTLAVVAKTAKLGTFFLSQQTRERLRKFLYARVGSDYAGAGALAPVFLNVTREDLSADAAKIFIPTLLLWGSEDKVTPLPDGKRLAQTISGSSFKIFDGAGHNVHMERPREVAEEIRHFI